MTENSVFIRNVSPLANKDSVMQIFNEIKDEILNVEFHKYPHSEQKFCQIYFKSSNGVTKSTSYNGSTLLGVPMSITVLPPVQINNFEQSRITSNREVFVKGVPVNYSDKKISSLFESYIGDVPIKITKMENCNASNGRVNLIAEFTSENTAQKLIERKNIYLNDEEFIEISNTYLSSFPDSNCKLVSSSSSSKAVSPSGTVGSNCKSSPSLLAHPDQDGSLTTAYPKAPNSDANSISNSESVNLNNLTVPLAYQQIRKVEWDMKLSKLDQIKRRIEDRILGTGSPFIARTAPSNCHNTNKISKRRRSLSRSLSPPL